MQILKYLLLLFFMNFCKSFSLNINNRFFSRYKLKLNMGCDYYIDKSLYILDYNDKILSFIELEKNRGYYWYDKDEDEPDYDFELYKKYILEPSFEPIIIYTNNSFINLSFEKKYEKLIDYELKICNKKWDDVNKVIKKEERYER